jgi:hypothetical protein
MKWAGRILVGMVGLLGAARLLGASPADPALDRQSGSNLVGSAAARLRSQFPPEPIDTPPVPVAQSPVMFFRDLLAMSATQQQRALTNRSPENQKIILAKLREYAAMDPDLRAQRLQATELRWYLQPLLVSPATNRDEQLATVPVSIRKSVGDRLREWDKLPPEVQKDLLANKEFLIYLTETAGLTKAQRHKVLEGVTPKRREILQAGIEQWSRMRTLQRQKLLGRFEQFFNLTVEEKQRALQVLSGPERRQIEKTLENYSNLPPEQRAECTRAIEKYTSLSLEERQQFLKNAERWKELSPAQRETWREIVNRMPLNSPPPLPPDLPPLPPPPTASPRTEPMVTNGN